MITTEKVKKIKADIILWNYNPNYKSLKIGFGEAFYFNNNKLWLSETPLSDPTLIPFKNVIIEKGILEFDAFYKKKNTHFIIKPLDNDIKVIMSFIQNYYERELDINSGFSDEVDIQIEEDDLSIRLVNDKLNRRLILTFSKERGNYLVQRFPEPSRKFKIKSCEILNNSLVIVCDNYNLYTETNEPLESIEYKWTFDVQQEILELITELIQVGLNRMK